MTIDITPDDLRLDEALAAFARHPAILLAIDFDGVLAPLVDNPANSRPLPASAAALTRILDSGIVVSYVSGRDRAGLLSVADADPRAYLIGSHGAEWPESLAAAHAGVHLDEAQRELLEQVTADLERIAGEHQATRVEYKPTARVLHTRLAEAAVAEAAEEAALDGPGRLDGVKVTPGKHVVEISVTTTDKGEAVTWLREHTGAERVCYLGDDVTDETVFRVLGDGDLSIKVGPGETAAAYRIESPADVAIVLTRLADLLG